MNTTIIGCGYLGGRIAQQLRDVGCVVNAIVRTEASAQKLFQMGVESHVLDLDDDLPALQEAAGCQLFYLAPPPRTGTEEHRVRQFLEAIIQSRLPSKLVYLSTTGVYGDCKGEWVDETRPVNPVADRALRRYSGEQQFLAWGEQMQIPVVILRVAGIYGPDRLPLARLKRREPIVTESEAPYTNRIYIDDLVTVCLAAMTRGGAGEIYNVSDGKPGNMTAYFNQVADFAGLPRPVQISLPEAQRQLSAGMLSYLRESRRLDNRKMLQQFDITLRYASLEQGLNALTQK